MHILLTIPEVLGGPLALAALLIIGACLLLTIDGSNPFQ